MTSNRFVSPCRLFVLTVIFLTVACEKKATPPSTTGDGSSHPAATADESSKHASTDSATHVEKSGEAAAPTRNVSKSSTDDSAVDSSPPVEIATIENATPPDPPLPVTGPMTMADGQVLNVRQKERDGVIIEQWCEKTKPGGIVVKEGPFARWHPHGGPYLKGTFVDGVQHGPLYSWYPNGQLRGIGQMDHGLKTGHWIKWDDSGTLRNEMNYRNDMKHGFWKEYDANGDPVTWGEHVDDRKHGIWYTTEADGSVSEERWDNGTVVKD